jgi:hypothetical protein
MKRLLIAACVLLMLSANLTHAAAVYAGDSHVGSDYGADYVGGQNNTSSSCGPIVPSSTTIWWFTINGMPSSSYTEWYVTSSGGTAVDTDNLTAYFDPQVGIQFTSTGTYTIRAEIWVGGTWVQAHRFTVTVQSSYTVTLDRQSGSGGSSSVTATYGSEMPSASAPSRTGYTFQGYYDGTVGSGTKYYNSNMSSARNWDKTQNTTLYAYWTANTYSVTFNKQGGSGGSDSVTATYGSEMPSASAPSRSGYTFYGYYTGTGGSGTKYYNANMSSARNWDGTSATTLYAYWVLPDLIVDQITETAASYVRGDTINARVRIKNTGLGSAGSSAIYYYLGSTAGSSSTGPSTIYKNIEGGSVSGLSPDATDEDIINWGGWTIPADVAAGQYRIWVKADYDNQIRMALT